MTIILDFKFEILDRGKAREKAAAKEPKEHQRGDIRFCVLCVLLRPSGLGGPISSSFRPKRTVRKIPAKSRLRNPLMLNAVKPVANQSADGLTKGSQDL